MYEVSKFFVGYIRRNTFIEYIYIYIYMSVFHFLGTTFGQKATPRKPLFHRIWRLKLDFRFFTKTYNLHIFFCTKIRPHIFFFLKDKGAHFFNEKREGLTFLFSLRKKNKKTRNRFNFYQVYEKTGQEPSENCHFAKTRLRKT